MEDAKVYEKEEWYVVMAFTDEGLRYMHPTGVFVTDVRQAEKWPLQAQADEAAAKVLENRRCPAMAKKLTVEYSVNNVHEIRPDEKA